MAARKKTAVKKKPAAKPKPARRANPATTAKPAKPPTAPSQFFTPDGGPWGRCFLSRSAGERRHWLVKSEPEVFSWDDLWQSPRRTAHWDGVRNYAARNFMRDGMKLGDLVFFYHSMADPQSIVGVCEVAREAYPDHTAFDKSSSGYDEDSTPDAPTWFMVDIRAVKPLAAPVTLPAMKSARSLAHLALIRTGRLSVIPLTPDEWETIMAMGQG